MKYETEIAQLGAALSDLVACVYAFATENEKGRLLDHRIQQIEASAHSIIQQAKRIADDRK